MSQASPSADLDSKGIICSQVDKPSAPILPRRLNVFDRMTPSSFAWTFPEGAPDTSVLGTPYHDSWIDGIVVNDQGQTYYMLRGHKAGPNQGTQRLLIRQAPLDGAVMKPLTDEAFSPMDLTVDPQAGFKYVTADPKQPRGEVTISPTGAFSWKEEGGVDLKGKLFTPIGLAISFPSRKDDKVWNQTYYNQHFAVEGVVKGMAVKGFVMWEHNYDHVGWLDSSLATGRGGMSFFANEFDDGSIESGIFYCGGLHRGAIVVNQKGDELLHTRIVNLDHQLDDEDHIVTSAYSFGDAGRWMFTPNKGAALNDKQMLIDFPFGFRAASFGKMIRVGEKRKWVRGWAVGEAGRTF